MDSRRRGFRSGHSRAARRDGHGGVGVGTGGNTLRYLGQIPTGYAGQAPFPGAAPTDAAGWTNVPASNSPAKEMRLRVLDFGTDKYGLNAYLFDSTNDNKVNYNKVLFSPTKDGASAVATESITRLRAGT